MPESIPRMTFVKGLHSEPIRVPTTQEMLAEIALEKQLAREPAIVIPLHPEVTEPPNDERFAAS